MKKRYVLSAALTVMVSAAALAGCGIDGKSAVKLTENIEAASIGEDSGSGDLIRKQWSFAAAEFDSIQLEATAMEIYFNRSEGDRAEVELLTDKAIDNRITMDASVLSRELRLRVTVEDTKSWLLDRAQKGQRKLVISLPDKTYDQVRIRNEFGQVEAADLKAKSTRVRLAAGTIRVSAVSGELDLETEAGSIEVEDVKLERDLKARTSAGNITVDLREPPEAAEVELRSVIGSVEADLAGLQLREDTDNRKEGAIGSGGPRLQANTEAGRILVR